MNKLKFLLLFLLMGGILQAQNPGDIKWWSPSQDETGGISGQFWQDELASPYHRLPARAQDTVRQRVWNLSKQAAGLSIRFSSNAEYVKIKYKLKGNIAMSHMPATGVSGLDLYGKDHNGAWIRCWGNYRLGASSSYHFKLEADSANHPNNQRDYQLFLPLYNEVDSLEIGVPANADFKIAAERAERPIVAYGTSICQGACATRPGMAWTNILERRLEQPMINLGFSGNGKLEPALIELIAEINAQLYILDCLPNLRSSRDDVRQLAIDAVEKLGQRRPGVPIILTEHIGYADDVTDRGLHKEHRRLNASLKDAYHHLLKSGYQNVYLLSKEDMGLDFDSYVDRIHPNDIGMLQYANAYEKLIRRILDAKQ